MNSKKTGKFTLKKENDKDLFWVVSFLYYTNDLPKCCEKAEMAMIIDHTTLIKARKRVDPLLQNDVKRPCGWFESNTLTVIAEKSETVSFGSGMPRILEVSDKKIIH